MRRGARAGVALGLILTLASGACGSSVEHGTDRTDSTPTTSLTASLLAQAALRPCPESVAASGTPLGPTLPDLTLPCLGGGAPVRLARLGRPTVVNLWASWCRPCATELPVFAAVERETGDRVLFVGVDTADPVDDALRALIDAGVRFPNVYDRQRKVQGRLGLAGLPATVFVRADGSIAHTKLGPVTGAAELRAALRTHLGVGT